MNIFLNIYFQTKQYRNVLEYRLCTLLAANTQCIILNL